MTNHRGNDAPIKEKPRSLGRRVFLGFAAKGGLAGAALAATGGAIGCGDDNPRIENEDDIAWDEATDIIIMGGGGAGLVAAVVAREAGSEVVVIEKSDLLGSTTESRSWRRSCWVGSPVPTQPRGRSSWPTPASRKSP